jgi:hypothetical protein
MLFIGVAQPPQPRPRKRRLTADTDCNHIQNPADTPSLRAAKPALSAPTPPIDVRGTDDLAVGHKSPGNLALYPAAPLSWRVRATLQIRTPAPFVSGRRGAVISVKFHSYAALRSRRSSLSNSALTTRRTYSVRLATGAGLEPASPAWAAGALTLELPCTVPSLAGGSGNLDMSDAAGHLGRTTMSDAAGHREPSPGSPSMSDAAGRGVRRGRTGFCFFRAGWRAE